MTEKRFTYIAFDGFEDNGEYITPYQVVELLNDLTQENKELKKEIVFLQKSLHNCSMKSRKLVISEMRDSLKKMERYE